MFSENETTRYALWEELVNYQTTYPSPTNIAKNDWSYYKLYQLSDDPNGFIATENILNLSVYRVQKVLDIPDGGIQWEVLETLNFPTNR